MFECFQRETSHDLQPKGIEIDKLKNPSGVSAVGLFTLPKLRTLRLNNVVLHGSFFAGVSIAASISQVPVVCNENISEFPHYQ